MLRPAAEFQEGEWVSWILEWLDEVLPDSVTWDNELHYLFNFSQQENAFHICHSFVECHTRAQTKVRNLETRTRARRPLWVVLFWFGLLPRPPPSGARRRRPLWVVLFVFGSFHARPRLARGGAGRCGSCFLFLAPSTPAPVWRAAARRGRGAWASTGCWLFLRRSFV